MNVDWFILPFVVTMLSTHILRALIPIAML